MAKILLYQYVDNIVEVSYGNWQAQQHSYFFDTVTLQTTHSQFTTTGGDAREFEGEPHIYPDDLTRPFHSNCNGTTKREYFHDGTGIVSVQHTENSLDCGWVPPFNISTNVFHVVCYGNNTGNITVQVESVFPPYTYRWNDGSTEQNRFNIPAGTYIVTVTDSKGFSDSKEVEVRQNNQIQVIGSIGNNSIEVSASGGIAPYTFHWEDGVNTKDRSDVAPGRYTLTVRDSVDCTQTVTFTISSERFFFSKNPVLLSLQAADYQEKPNLRFVCEVWVEPEYLSGNFMLATPEPFEHPADQYGRTQFDVREILDAFVEPHLPDFNQKVVKRADKAFKRFFLRHTEAYGDPVVLDPFTVQDNRYVLCGGLDDPEHFAGTYFNNYRQNRKPFFTWEPAVKETFVDQQEFLYFMPDSFELTDFRVRVKVVLKDGGTQTIEPFTQGDIRRFELYAIPTGHNQLGLGSLQPGKEVRSWEVYVVDGFNNVLSETRRYKLSTGSFAQVRYFIYANSLGGYNTLAATGRARLSVDPKAQLIERSRPVDALSGDSIILSKNSQRTLELSTGHKSRAELLALQDFLNSADVKLIGSDRFIPGRLSDKSADVLDEDPLKLPAISFDFILNKMHSYTPQLRLSGYPDESALLKPLNP
ncbi:SprB repeat-containing protein [Pontibacter kalidii]|uniref:SprB repeat-containing protein n=1 Tax=Pontibacter kalidii TaxID=2592049 RepID=UPI00224CC4BF|nr:SprB repeat-containing protein [Pontibacter kalidii]